MQIYKLGNVDYMSELREINSTDKVNLQKFFAENNIPTTVKGFSAFPLDQNTVDSICLKNHKDKYYLFMDQGIIKGFSMLRGWEEGYSIPSFGIIVDHKYQGRGIGSKILELTLEKCQFLGCKKMRLSVYSTNISALNLYKKFGFYEIERTVVYNCGEVEEKIIMIKDLL